MVRLPVLETLEPRFLLSGAPVTPLAEWVVDGTRVSVYDVAGEVDVNPADISVTTQYGGYFVKVTIGGSQPAEGLGMIVSGQERSLRIKDARTGVAGDLAFVVSNDYVWSASLRSGIPGYDLNGLSAGGIDFAADIDGDARTDDKTALSCKGLLGSFKIAGDAEGDFHIPGGGAFSTKLIVSGLMADVDVRMGAAGSLHTIRAGAWEGGALYGAEVRKLIIGNRKAGLAGDMTDVSVELLGIHVLGNTLGTLSVGGNLANCIIEVLGRAGSVYVSAWGAGTTLAVGVYAGEDGQYLTPDDEPDGGRLGKLTIGSHQVAGAAPFGIVADEFGTLTVGGSKLYASSLPFQTGQFSVAAV